MVSMCQCKVWLDTYKKLQPLSGEVIGRNDYGSLSVVEKALSSACFAIGRVWSIVGWSAEKILNRTRNSVLLLEELHQQESRTRGVKCQFSRYYLKRVESNRQVDSKNINVSIKTILINWSVTSDCR